MSDRTVVVTGLGPITAIGEGVDGLRSGLRRERSPVRAIQRFDASPFRTRIAAEVDGFQPEVLLGPRRARRVDRFSAFGLASTALALEDASLDPGALSRERVAVQLGTALGGVAYAEEQHASYVKKGLRGINPLLALSVFGGAASCNIAIEYGFTGPNSTNAMSCASGAIGIGDGFRRIRAGDADVAICGGSEAPLAPLTFGAFAIIRAMSTRNGEPAAACRPFDEGRDGFVMGEGAAVLVLESLEHATRRGARIYAEICGFGTTSDAYHMTQPRPGGEEAARAMRIAIEDAGISASVIDYVNAHGSSTPLNDSTEAGAIRSVFGDRAARLPVSGTKAYYGHALGASGAIEAAITVLGIHDGWLPPSLNLDAPDDASFGLAFVPPGGIATEVEHALSNSFGFGGINAALLFRRFEA